MKRAVLLVVLAGAASATALGQTVERVNVAMDGGESAGGVAWPCVSADGRYVAFASPANDLVPGDTNERWDVFVRDLRARETVRVSVSSAGVEGDLDSGIDSEHASRAVAISSDGRYVAFISEATNLEDGVIDPGPQRDVFVHDLAEGVTRRIPDMTGAQSVWISADGRFVFSFNGEGREWDRQTGATEPRGDASGVMRSRDGGIVAVTHTAGCVDVGPVGSFQYLLGPVCLSTVDAIISLIDMSDDGLHVVSKIRYVVAGTLFESCVYGPLPPPSVEAPCIVGFEGGEAGSINPAMSASGYYYAHVDVDTGRALHLFERNPAGGTWTHLERGYNGLGLDAPIESVDVADTAMVVLTSAASNLTAGDTNGAVDLFAVRGMVPTKEVGLELSVLVDASSSVTPEQYTRMVDGLRGALADPTVVPRDGSVALRVGVFDDEVRERIAWTGPDCPCELVATIERVSEDGAMKRDVEQPAAVCVRQALIDEPPAFDFNRYYGGRRVLLLIGAGESLCTSVEELAAARDLAFTWIDEIDAVAMDDEGGALAQYRDGVTGPAGQGFVVQARGDFSDAAEKIRDAVGRIGGAPNCGGDLSRDGVVDFGDYLAFLEMYTSNDCQADLNADCQVGFEDYLEFLMHFDQGC